MSRALMDFDRPWLILCEGEADKRLIHRLLTKENIDQSKMSIAFPGKEEDPSGGRSKFGKWLSLRYTSSGTFKSTVKAVIIVSDNDDDPAESWGKVQEQLRAAGGIGVPQKPLEVAKSTGWPDVVVLMVPTGTTGAIDKLCLEALLQKWDYRAPLTKYTEATPAATWRPGKKDKMQLQCLLSAICEPSPDTSLARHWLENPKYHVPLDFAGFQCITNFFRNLDGILTPAPTEST